LLDITTNHPEERYKRRLEGSKRGG
jgi:hypothetical protein